MASMEDILNEVNKVLRAYNYLDAEDDNVEIEDLPSLISHLLLLRVFTHESIRFNVPYDEVNPFCEFAIDYLYQKEDDGEDVSKIEVEDIVDEFNASKGPKH